MLEEAIFWRSIEIERKYSSRPFPTVLYHCSIIKIDQLIALRKEQKETLPPKNKIQPSPALGHGTTFPDSGLCHASTLPLSATPQISYLSAIKLCLVLRSMPGHNADLHRTLGIASLHTYMRAQSLFSRRGYC